MKKKIVNQWDETNFNQYLIKAGFKEPILDDKVKSALVWDLQNAPFVKMNIVSMIDYDDNSQELTIKFTHDGKHKQSEAGITNKFVTRERGEKLKKHFKAFKPGGVLHEK